MIIAHVSNNDCMMDDDQLMKYAKDRFAEGKFESSGTVLVPAPDCCETTLEMSSDENVEYEVLKLTLVETDEHGEDEYTIYAYKCPHCHKYIVECVG